MIDSHAHIYLKPLCESEDEVARRAAEVLSAVINAGVDIETSHESIALSERHPIFWASVGIHPNEANDCVTATGGDNVSAKIERMLNHPKVVAIGEIGLDYYRDYSPKDKQTELFRLQLDIARGRKKPVVLHIRNAHEDFIQIFENYKDVQGVLHAFSGSQEVIDWVLQNTGLYFGLGGPITFKNFKETDQIRTIPLSRVLLETDCPYLAPHPYRGKTNEPSYIPLIAAKLAEIHGVSTEEVDRITSQNARKLFGIPLPIHGNSQVFLRSDHILDKIAGTSCSTGATGATGASGETGVAGETALEIGAGEGILTSRLAARFKKVYAIEPDLSVYKGVKGVVVLPESVLDVDISAIARYENEKITVFGNIPYHITSPILFHLFEHRDAVDKIVLLMQKEVAVRLCADAGNKDYGIPTVLLGNVFDIKLLFDVPPGAFSPVPKVDSAVILMTPRLRPLYPEISDGIFETVVKAAFGKRRKVLRTVFKDLGDLGGLGAKRAEELSTFDFGHIADLYRSQIKSLNA